MNKNYNDAAFFLILQIAIILILTGGQLLGIHWPFSEKTAFSRLLMHPALALFCLPFSISLLILLRLKNENTYKLIFGIATAAFIYGAYLIFVHAIFVDFLMMFCAIRMMRFSAPVALHSITSKFSKPIHQADETK